MSILIRGMDMPKDCWECAVQPVCIGFVDFSIRGRRPMDCPLVEVPKHGRLIDADALDDAFTDMRWKDGDYRTGKLAHWGDRPNWCLSGRDIDGLIQSAPTIITAEEDEGCTKNL